MSKRRIISVVSTLALLSAAGCVTRADLEDIKKNQEEIRTRLGKLENARPAPSQPAAQPGRPDPNKIYSVPVGDAVTQGPDDAWVTIVEVSDFQCPFCNRVNPTLKQIKEKYGDDVRIAFKHNPLSFHKRAQAAALAAECARDQNKFWEMHDQLFANQRALEDADLEKYAQQIGLNMTDYKACYSSGKYNERILQQQRAMVSLGARGTPAFFINGRFLSGAQPLASFERLIDEELNKAKASGMSKGEYYTKAVVEKGEKSL